VLAQQLFPELAAYAVAGLPHLDLHHLIHFSLYYILLFGTSVTDTIISIIINNPVRNQKSH